MTSKSTIAIKWEEIDTVLLDMDGTLLDLHYDDHFWQEHLPKRYAELNQLSADKAKEILEPRFKEMEGTLEWYCLDFWSEELQMNIPELKKEVQHLIAIHDGVIDFLKQLHAHEKNVYLVTNAHEKVLSLKMEKTQLHHQFDKLISSHQYGLPKENPEFWHRLIDEHFFDPDRTIFFDDSLPVLKSAKTFGIKHIYGIRQPSTQKPEKTYEDFPMIASFSQILP